MSVRPIASPPRRDTFAVIPVVEYEPPTRNVPQCRQSSHATLRPHPARSTRRQPAAAPAVRAAAASTPMRQAAAFADAALRRVLEVIDRRRPAAQLRPLLAPSLVDSVLSVGRAASGHAAGQGSAVLRRTRLQPAGRDAPQTAAEVFGTYSRGDRVHAIACRVELLPTANGTKWLVVALHIG
ncbi:Rv3235 family protein [Mycobacterium lacus]|nr:Rv3235 family protein [Mycobacterium lacus]MCV7123008.1 hypothetical protein [Mycobacterium lacus]ORW05308.1 hypothetical protein AWC15_02100 [Mycobacterium lacus]